MFVGSGEAGADLQKAGSEARGGHALQGSSHLRHTAAAPSAAILRHRQAQSARSPAGAVSVSDLIFEMSACYGHEEECVMLLPANTGRLHRCPVNEVLVCSALPVGRLSTAHTI